MKKVLIIFSIVFIAVFSLTLSFLYFNKRESINLGLITIKIPFTKESEFLEKQFYGSKQEGENYEISGKVTYFNNSKITVDNKKESVDIRISLDTFCILSEVVNNTEQKREINIYDSENEGYLQVGKYVTVTYEYKRENDDPRAKKIIIWDFIE